MCAYRVTIRVGTPPQWVNVFVSTASEETWVVGPGGGCAGSRSSIFLGHPTVGCQSGYLRWIARKLKLEHPLLAGDSK